ncbi:MAG: hypothetical protein JW850_17315 [Thermoflexales bacterium]|nr:hypothetical protein [Thermoflexales bacterium]
MSESLDTFVQSMDNNQERAAELMERLLAAAQPGAVFGKPVKSGDYTVITASEVGAGGGFGIGSGMGAEPARDVEAGVPGGAGSGIGGGGGSMGRPVAAIVIGPDGVKVEAIVDVTKAMLAFFTAWGAMGMMLTNMKKQSKG